MKAYRLGAICDAAAAAAALEAVGDRFAFTAGSAARRRDVVKKRDRKRTDSVRGTRKGLNPGRQKPLERLAIMGLMLFEGRLKKKIIAQTGRRLDYYGSWRVAIQSLSLNVSGLNF
jgi:hypothetical protein